MRGRHRRLRCYGHDPKDRDWIGDIIERDCKTKPGNPVWTVNETARDQTACPEPDGCCTATDGSTTQTKQSACTAPSTWAKGACPDPTGGCCHGPAGNRSWTPSLTHAECKALSNYFGWEERELSRNTSTCPEPTGGCCYGVTGAKEWQGNITQSACTAKTNGQWTQGQTSRPATCPMPGGCCDNGIAYNSGVSQTDCAAVQPTGTWRWRDLSADQCVLEPLGCCTVGSTETNNVTERRCTHYMSGTWAGGVVRA